MIMLIMLIAFSFTNTPGFLVWYLLLLLLAGYREKLWVKFVFVLLLTPLIWNKFALSGVAIAWLWLRKAWVYESKKGA